VKSENEKSWSEARVMSGDVKTNIAKLKSEPGNDLIAWGGVAFARSLIREGLVDQFDLTVYPVVIGQGLSIFAELPKQTTLELVSESTFSRGVVGHVYRVAPPK
jgi:dihydrofolate reductase